MTLFARITSFSAALALLLAFAANAAGADAKGAVEKIKAKNQAASTAYTDGDFDRTKRELLDAIAIAKENDLGGNRLLAQTYMLLGVLEVNERKNSDLGARYFAKALEISPAAQVPPSMMTKAVKNAFAKAEDGKVSPADEPDTATAAEAPPSKKGSAKNRDDAADDDKQARAVLEATEKRQAEGAARQREREKEKQEEEKEKQRLADELAQAKVAQSMGQAEKEKLQKERQEKDKALSEAKAFAGGLEKESKEKEKQIASLTTRLQQAEKERSEKDKQLTEAKARVQQLEKDKADRDKWLAGIKESEKKEREAKEALQKEKVERDKQLTEAKARVQQLEKDKADRDKWLAAAKESEKKEREAREKAEKTIGDVAARDRERRTREDQERRDREKLAEGPDLPRHIPEPLYCTMPDEIQAAADLFVHCVPRTPATAKVITLHFRPSGVAVYNSIIMERNKKGWYMALVPGNRISGKLLQYYVEARDAKQNVTASNGKSSSPNVISVRQGSPPRADRLGGR